MAGLTECSPAAELASIPREIDANHGIESVLAGARYGCVFVRSLSSHWADTLPEPSARLPGSQPVLKSRVVFRVG